MNLLWLCDEIWVFGEIISEGMEAEIRFCKNLNLPVRYIADTRDEAETWVNLYARYDVQEDSLSMEYIVSKPNEEESHDYIPTESETGMIKEAICEKMKEYYDCTPEEFCQRENGLTMH